MNRLWIGIALACVAVGVVLALSVASATNVCVTTSARMDTFDPSITVTPATVACKRQFWWG